MGEFPLRAPAASTYANQVDLLYLALMFLTVVFTTIVGVGLLILVIRFRRGNNVDRSRPVGHNTLLELSWSVGPLILAMGIFLWNAKLFTSVYAAPPDAKEIFVIGKQWMWHLQHANGVRENNELHIPVGQPVKLTMISQDVIHAFYVPEFRLQRQVEPGHYSTMWFTPTRPGKYHMYCNMYCGTQHSEMGGWVYVMDKADYARWAASGGSKGVAVGGLDTPSGGLTLAQKGAALYQQFQCVSCHSTEAVARRRGPSLYNLYGKTRQLANGKIVTADDNYLRNVLYYPNEYTLAGWPQGMPSYKGSLTEDQVLAINAYVKSLSATPATVNNTNPTTQRTGGGSSSASGFSTQGAGVSQQNSVRTGGSEATDVDGGAPNSDAPAANTDNQQWRYMYGGEQYK